MFVVLNDDLTLDNTMIDEIKTKIRKKNTSRHVPAFVFQISEIPVTRSGKPVELSVKAILNGKTVLNRSTLSNPIILDEIEKIKKEFLSV